MRKIKVSLFLQPLALRPPKVTRTRNGEHCKRTSFYPPQGWIQPRMEGSATSEHSPRFSRLMELTFGAVRQKNR